MSYSLLFDDVSKHYRGSREYHGSLREDFVQGLGRLVGRKPNGRHVVRALDHVSLEVPEGDSFALIGENGAGKSTALKVATRITYPSSGTVRVRGRVGALVEVGTGLHPELSGRENIHLFGSILGHTRRDIARRFDAIVEFAGIGTAIDQPVKQYSTGMELRVGFAVAAHLEPDLLLVDEAIAVGDAGFHYRCVERMSELVREGRTRWKPGEPELEPGQRPGPRVHVQVHLDQHRLGPERDPVRLRAGPGPVRDLHREVMVGQ